MMKPIIFVLSLLLASTAHAELTVGVYLRDKVINAPLIEGQNLILIAGEGSALITENYVIGQMGGKPLFCLPRDKGLNGAEVEALLDKGIKRISATMTADDVNNSPLSAVILFELMKTYPCSKSP